MQAVAQPIVAPHSQPAQPTGEPPTNIPHPTSSTTVASPVVSGNVHSIPESKVGRIFRGLLRVLWPICWAIAGIAVGILIVKSHPAEAARLAFGPPGKFKIVAHPDPTIERVGVELIVAQATTATTSLQLIAGQLSSRRIIDALVEKQKAGISVTIIIPSPSSKSSALIRALTDDGFTGLYQHPNDFDEDMMIVDHKAVLVGNIPWSVSAAKSMAGSVIFTSGRDAVEQVSKYFDARLFEAKQIR